MTDAKDETAALREELTAARRRIAELEAAAAERERTGRERRKKEAWLQAVLSSLHETAVAVWDRDGVYTTAMCPPEMQERYQASLSDFVGKSLYDVFPVEVADARVEEIRRLLRDGGTVREEYQMELPGGLFWHDITVAPIREAGRAPTHVVGVIRDITERKHMEQAQRASEALLRATIDSIPFDFFALDADGRYMLQNPTCREHWGEMLGKRPCEIGAPAEALAIWEENNRRAFAGETVTGEVTWTIDGERRHFYNVIAPIRDGDEVRGILGFNFDRTAQKRAEQKLRESEEQLQQAQKMDAIGRLAGGVAHDFNNLLTAIDGYCALIRTQLGCGQTVEQEVEQIEQASALAGSLTRKLLAFSRQEGHAPEQVDLNRLVLSFRQMLQRIIGPRIEVRTELGEGLPPVHADPRQIEQVLLNLAVNARDAMPHGGTLTLRTRGPSGNGLVRLSVADTGTGIPEDLQGKVFEPFFTTKGREQGTGLGLSTVYGIVRQHGGRIELSSRLDEGTLVDVYLRTVEREPGEASTVEHAGSKLVGGGRRVLLVEDEPLVLGFAEKALRLHGYEVCAVATATDALAAFDGQAKAFDLVLTDIVLPDMDGLELLELLLERQPALRALCTSGYMDEQRYASAPEAMRHPFMPKPYSMQTLLQKVEEVLGASCYPEHV